MMSPSGLYLTCVSARSCPERRIGLIFAVNGEGRDGSRGGRGLCSCGDSQNARSMFAVLVRGFSMSR